jgi:hypothetical protein
MDRAWLGTISFFILSFRERERDSIKRRRKRRRRRRELSSFLFL